MPRDGALADGSRGAAPRSPASTSTALFLSRCESCARERDGWGVLWCPTNDSHGASHAETLPAYSRCRPHSTGGPASSSPTAEA
jgi:hypothetical protein